MTTQSNEIAMRAAGKRKLDTINKAAIAILVAVTKDGVDEPYVAKLRYEFMIGALIGTSNIGYNAAIDYLPALDAKPGQKGRWQDFPVNAPETFDPAKHCPREVHDAYRAGLMAWSRVRAAAGLPSLKASSTKATQQPSGEGDTGKSDAPVTLESFVVPNNLDTVGMLALARQCDDILRANLSRTYANIATMPLRHLTERD